MERILHVIGGMNAGGMETMIMNYYRRIDRKKIQFDFLIFNRNKCFYEDEIERLGGKIYRIETSRRKSIIKNHKEVKEFFKNNKYNIVEFHQGITYYYPLKMAKKYNVSTRIIHNHGIDRNFLKKYKIYNELFAKIRISNLATNYFTCSPEVNQQLFSKKVIKNKRIEVIPNSIDVKKFEFSKEKREKIRKAMNIDDNTIVYGHIGTFTYPKNHEFLLRIFNEIVKKNENTLLLLIGEGKLKENIEKEAKNFKIYNKIKFLGIRKDIEELLSAMDVFIFPSLFEGIPLTLLEAQASGIPIFLSETIDKRTIINDNLYVKSLKLEPQKWAEDILKLNKNDEKERMLKNTIIENTDYNIVKSSKKLEEIYLSYEKERN